MTIVQEEQVEDQCTAPRTDLIDKVRRDVIGRKAVVSGPFGPRQLVYCDYTASGRHLGAVEEFMGGWAAPVYANTHTEQSHCGQATTGFVEQAREIIIKSVRADPKTHVVLFCGSGATAAIDKVVRALTPEITKYGKDTANRPIVLVGPYEHHSNEVTWRETGAEVVAIPENNITGNLEPADVERFALLFKDRPIKIASFSAGSNVTGICPDMVAITTVLKANEFLSFWDCAAAGPYLDLHIGQADAFFFSPHKFIGGPGSAGVLVARRDLFRNVVPTVPGGGTVAYVNHTTHKYKTHIEEREEGGTPGILQAIRSGLVFSLKESVGAHTIHQSEMAHLGLALSHWSAHPSIELLGADRSAYHSSSRLPIISFRIRAPALDGVPSAQFLHHNFVVALLNDLYGIQARAGCFCAGPYMHRLLGYKDSQTEIIADPAIIRAGAARLSVNYFMTEAETKFVVAAVMQIATFGWALLPLYTPEISTGLYRYTGPTTNNRTSSAFLPRVDGFFNAQSRTAKSTTSRVLRGEKCIREADRLMKNAAIHVENASKNEMVADFMHGGHIVPEPENVREVRWFATGSEMMNVMRKTPANYCPAAKRSVGVRFRTSILRAISNIGKTSEITDVVGGGHICRANFEVEKNKESAKFAKNEANLRTPVGAIITAGN